MRSTSSPRCRARIRWRSSPDNPAFTVTEGASTTKELLAYNDRVAPFDNVKVRKALARAIDKAKLLQLDLG